MNIKEEARKAAVQNAVKFGGKANPGSVIGKILAEFPNAKKDMQSIAPVVQEIVQEVNALSPEDLQKENDSYGPVEQKPKEKKDIFDNLNIKDTSNIITAFPPEPSKYPHIGHAKAILLNYHLAKKYNGTFILRFEDTNPTLAKQEYYDIHLQNYEWLGVKPDQITYASDFMEKYYELLQTLIDSGQAYVDTADNEAVRESRQKGTPTADRSNTVERNQKLWEEMKTTAAEGSMIVRLKIDLQHKNSTMRDPTLMRIIEHEHPRLGTTYRVWPTFDFENSVMDGLQTITHRLRSKEFEMRTELQNYIQNLLKLPQSNIIAFARFNLEGVESSGRIIRDLIEENKLIGWDDPSLTTLVALQRRGFLPQAIWNFVVSTGISKSEATLTWDDLIMHNKRLLDDSAPRYFCITDPQNVTVHGAPNKEAKIPIYPNDESKGHRTLQSSQNFILEEKDVAEMKEGLIYRFIDGINVEKKGDELHYHSDDYESYKQKPGAIIHWLPDQENNIPVSILMPDKATITGIAEPDFAHVEQGTVLQFQRFGFCRLDDKEKKSLWFTH